MDPEDPLIKMQVELDQHLAMVPELARMAWGYFEGFKGQGFTDNQALYLTAAQLHTTPGDAPS